MADAPRRLYEYGFDGWDISQGCYATAYLVMAVGIATALMAWSTVQRDRSFATLWGLMSQFAIFALLEGCGYGFIGITHHILDTFFEQGYSMGRSWGVAHSEWMISWTLAALIIPLASSSCLGTALAFGEFGIGWIKITKGFGVAIAILEVYLCVSGELDQSGTLSVYWGLLTSCLACFAVIRRGFEVAGVLLMACGNLARTVGYSVLIWAPASCKMTGPESYSCPYPSDFNHNAVYQCFIAASVLSIYFGVTAKYSRDKEVAYFNTMQRYERGDRMCTLPW